MPYFSLDINVVIGEYVAISLFFFGLYGINLKMVFCTIGLILICSDTKFTIFSPFKLSCLYCSPPPKNPSFFVDGKVKRYAISSFVFNANLKTSSCAVI